MKKLLAITSLGKFRAMKQAFSLVMMLMLITSPLMVAPDAFANNSGFGPLDAKVTTSLNGNGANAKLTINVSDNSGTGSLGNLPISNNTTKFYDVDVNGATYTVEIRILGNKVASSAIVGFVGPPTTDPVDGEDADFGLTGNFDGDFTLANLNQSGGMTLLKTVDGVAFTDWAEFNQDKDIFGIISGITFTVYQSDENGFVGQQVAEGTLDIDGVISFFPPVTEPGWYFIEEHLTGTAFETFVPGVYEIVNFGKPEGIYPEGPFAARRVVGGDRMFHLAGLQGSVVTATSSLSGNNTWRRHWTNVVWPGRAEIVVTDQTFAVYRMSINANGEIFTSFCGDRTIYTPFLTGLTFQEERFVTTDQRERLIAAYDWIYANYGAFESLNQYNYAIAQMLTWAIIHDFDEITIGRVHENREHDMTPSRDIVPGLIEDTRVLVNDILSVYMDEYAARVAAGTANVVDILELVDSVQGGQPQIIPVFGSIGILTFDNTERMGPPITEGELEVFADFKVSYDKVTFECDREVKRNNTDTLVSHRATAPGQSGAFNNGHTWVAINVAAARADNVKIGIANSSPSNTPIGYSYNVKIEGNNITVYFDDNLIRANFGFEVQNAVSQLAGGPSNINHRVTSSRTISMPAGYGDTVYLFFHNAGGIQWYGEATGECREVSRETIFVSYAEKFNANELTLTVNGPNGEEVIDDWRLFLDFDDKLNVFLPSQTPGVYSVTLSGDGFNDITRTGIVVVENETTIVNFGTISINLPDVEIKG